MAVAAQFDQDKEKQQQPSQMGMGQAPAAGGAMAAPQMGVSGGAPQQKAGSGRFTNIQQYLQANKGAGQQIAGKVAGQVGQQTQQAQRSAGEAEGIRSAVEGEKQRLGQAQTFAQQIEQDPTKITQNQQQMQQFQSLLKPQGTAGQLEQQAGQQFGTALSNIQQAQQAAQGLGTEAGRFGLLRKAFQTPSYSRGQQRLDQLLFQTGGAPIVQEKQKEYQNLLGQLATGTQKSQEQIMSDIAGAKQAEAEAATTLGGKLTEQQQKFAEAQQKEVQDTLAQREAKSQSLQKFFTQGFDALNDDEKALVNEQLSGAGALGQRTYNVLADNKWAQYLNQGKRDITAKDVVTPEEFSRYQALAQLSGLTPEQMQFTEAGKGAGAEAGLSQQKLAEDLTAAQKYFEEKSKGTTLATTLGLSDIVSNGSFLLPTELYGATASNTAANLLANIENIVGSGGSYDLGRALSNASATGGFGRARELVKNRLQQQLQQYLQEQGYYNTLGGIKPEGTV